MRKRLINGKDFTAMVLSAAVLLRERAEEINRLNVFPVPDGDTGSNMSRTMQAGVEKLASHEYEEIGLAAKALSDGMLMGARGNSGVILSQLFYGFAKAVQDKQTLTVADWANALQAGVDAAYRAVTNPVEGTVLTVAREAAAFGLSTASAWEGEPAEWWAGVVEKAKMTLNQTPELLPVLKQAGVVDSGGQGLVYIYEGILAASRRGFVETVTQAVEAVRTVLAPFQSEEPELPALLDQAQKGIKNISVESIEHFYDMEFFIRIRPDSFDEADKTNLRNELSRLGDSVLVVSADEFVKVHVHSKSPGDVLNAALAYGELTKMHFENMRDQHYEWLRNHEQEPAISGDQVVVAVSAGKGISEIYQSLGAGGVVLGGQSMNPSVEELLHAIRSVNAKTVFLLPNNKNIQLAAELAAERSDAHVIVIQSQSIPQGMSALLAFDESKTPDLNKLAMEDAIKRVKSGYVTYAVKHAVQDGFTINEHDILAVYEGKIVDVGQHVETVSGKLLEQMLSEEDEMVTLFYGQDVDPSDAKKLAEQFTNKYDAVDVELINGGQPLHYYIFSVE